MGGKRDKRDKRDSPDSGDESGALGEREREREREPESDPAPANPSPDARLGGTDEREEREDPAAEIVGDGAVDEATDVSPVSSVSSVSSAHLRGLLEALVFASDKPVKLGELARLASAPTREVKDAMSALRSEYAQRGVVLDEIAGGWTFRTHPQYAPFVRELAGGKPVKLTRAQLETLAMVAFRQPITRPEIDDIRGVDSGATLKVLLERDLVRILGKKDEPGRPLLYGTTTHFLEFFNMKSLRDLPTLREFTELSDESRIVAEAELGDVIADDARGPDGAAATRSDVHDDADDDRETQVPPELGSLRSEEP